MNESIFVEKPNLPKFNVSELIVSGRYKFVIDELKRLGISIIAIFQQFICAMIICLLLKIMLFLRIN